MTQIGSIYAEALYALAKDEGCSETVLKEMKALDEVFRTEPDFLRLLAAPNLSKDERCSIADASLRDKVNPYLLNFIKILTEKGYIRQFADCFEAYRQIYNRDNGILEVTAVTAVPMTEQQTAALTGKISSMTGKTVELLCRVDPACLGGVRLDYDGKRVDDTVANRLASIGNLLKNTVL